MSNPSAFKREVRQHFDARASHYDRDTTTHDRQDFVNFATVVPYLVEHSGIRVLEVATGTGILLERLLEAGKNAYGVDLSTGLLKVAMESRRIPRERLLCGDAEHLAFRDRSFDAACVFRSLHHMESPALVLREMIRCARTSVFVYDSAGEWRRVLKRGLQGIGLYQPLHRLLRGHADSGYRPPSETEGPVKVYYAEDAVRCLRAEGLRIVKTMKLHGNLFIHAERPGRG